MFVQEQSACVDEIGFADAVC